MAEEEKNNDAAVKEEKEKLDKLGVSETFSLLKGSGDKKKKPDEKKPAFRGFH